MLKILKASEPLEVKHLVVTVYSPPGLGKTSLGFTAESPLLLDFDGGAYRSKNRGDTVTVSNWSDVESISQDDLKNYKTLVIDTAGRALDCLSVDIIGKNPKLGRGGALTLQGFGELKAKFIAYTKLIRSFGMDIVLLAHSDEQRSGDEIIERLDMQGGSKNEIYKAADIMGRIKIVNGKRTLNFNPTDTAFGKNPAGLPELAIPDFAEDPLFLAGVIYDVKEALNKQTEEQKKNVKELADWQAKISSLETAEQFNAMMPETAKASDAIRDNTKRLLVKVAKGKGLSFDTKAKAFKAAA